MRLLALFTVAALAAGCPPPPNFLDGSIKQSHDLTFDTVELRLLTDQRVFQLSYFKNLEKNNPAAGVDTVVKLTFNEPAGGVTVDKEIDLLAAETAGRVERVTAANDTFPASFTSGTVTFHKAPAVNATTNGEFAITFDNGKTLDGTFETKVQTASF